VARALHSQFRALLPRFLLAGHNPKLLVLSAIKWSGPSAFALRATADNLRV